MPAANAVLPLDTESATQLATALNRCFETLEAPTELFTPDVFLDLLPPFWRFQLQGRAAFGAQLRAVATAPVSSRMIRVVPTSEGFVLEHEETQHQCPAGDRPTHLAVPGRRRPHRRGHVLLQRWMGRRAARPSRCRSADVASVIVMTTIDRSPATRLTSSSVLERAHEIAHRLPALAADIESARRLPGDLVDTLIAAGCFRILLPTSHGGAGATLDEALRLYEDLARGDASTGWAVMIGASGWCDLAGLPRDSFDALFEPSADVIMAGAIAPTGSISAVADGYELTGRWGFASGCDHATTFFANAVESVTEGRPALRVAVLDRAEVTIEDTWYVAGLRGTGSHHFTVAGVTVPRERTFVPLVGPPCVDVPIARIPSPAVFALGIAAVAIGAAQGALDTVVDLAQDKVPLLAAGPLAADPLFHHDLARADAELGAARSLVEAATGRLWERATAGAEATLDDRARARAAATWATEAALATSELAYRAGGGGAVYETSPLQRRLRDVHAMTQHFLVRPDSYAIAGAILAGQGLSAPVL